MTKIDIASVFREAIAQNAIRASAEQWKIINAILLCRTPALGGHLYECTGCQRELPVYNSCMNRHCPKCQGGATAKWLEARAKELLDVPYFHLVFTIPHELGFVALTNKAVFYDILFQASAKALKRVAERAHGGQIGFFSVLHTWTQTLELHPHIHSVVPGIIVTRDRSARRTRNNYFVSRRRLALGEFIRRFLLHTLPPQFVRIRHYGFLANGLRTTSLLRLRATLGEHPFETSPSVSAACPHCGCWTLRYKTVITPLRPTGSQARKTKLLPLSP